MPPGMREGESVGQDFHNLFILDGQRVLTAQGKSLIDECHDEHDGTNDGVLLHSIHGKSITDSS